MPMIMDNPRIWDPAQAMEDVVSSNEMFAFNPPVYMSSMFTFKDPDDMTRAFHGEEPMNQETAYLYTRHSNPTTDLFGEYLAAMGDMEACQPVSSGMAAITCVLMQITSPGDEIISSPTIYGGTYAYKKEILEKKWGVKINFSDFKNLEKFEQLINGKTKLVYFETIANPTLNIVDIGKVSEICRANNICLVVDNTFGIMIVTPSHYGADIVIHSLTKFGLGQSEHVAALFYAVKNLRPN